MVFLFVIFTHGVYRSFLMQTKVKVGTHLKQREENGYNYIHLIDILIKAVKRFTSRISYISLKCFVIPIFRNINFFF